jgi:putative FmdB family regulatory protein
VPTYEYRCPDGHDFEHFVLRISEASSAMTCPTCGKAATRKISAGGGLLFKGTGFYITDYGKDGKKDQRAAAKSSATKSSTAKPAESAASDAKPADTAAKPTESKAPAPSGSGDK